MAKPVNPMTQIKVNAERARRWADKGNKTEAAYWLERVRFWTEQAQAQIDA